MEKKIITISREYGSGGRQIGLVAAKKLGMEFYDKELIDFRWKTDLLRCCCEGDRFSSGNYCGS